MLVDEMPAGREMDALVAEKVMGWQWLQSKWEEEPIIYRSLFNPQGREKFNSPLATMNEPISPSMTKPDGNLWLPYYSTYITAMWEVVEKLIERNLDFYIYTSRGGWVCELNIYYVDDDEALIITEGHTPMLSICRAALKTVGINEIPSD